MSDKHSVYSSFFDDIIEVEEKPKKPSQPIVPSTQTKLKFAPASKSMRPITPVNKPSAPTPQPPSSMSIPLDLGGFSDSDSDNQPSMPQKVMAPVVPPKPIGNQRPTTPASRGPVSRSAGGAAKKHRMSKKDTAALNAKNKDDLLNVFDIYEKITASKMSHPDVSNSNSVIEVVDVLGQGNLDIDVLDDIKKLYSPTYWKTQLPQQLPLYSVDDEEKNRPTLGGRGLFDHPKSFALIAAMLKRNKVTAQQTTINNNNTNNNNSGFNTPLGASASLAAAAMASKDKVTKKEFRDNLVMLSKQEVIPRCYEESMLTSPSETENPCNQGSTCLCSEWFGFIMKEFITPLEYASMKEKGTRLEVTKMCLLCTRKAVAYMYMLSKLVGFEQQLTCSNQPHSNMINTIGEYTYHYCLEPGEGMLEPFVINFRQGYVAHSEVRDGVTYKWLTQDGYKKCDQNDIDELNFRLGTLRLGDASTRTDLSTQSRY